MISRALLRAAGLAAVMVVAPGCASDGAGASPTSEREDRCIRLLRDMRLYCTDGGVRGEHAATSIDCLRRRIEFERACI